MSIARRKFFYFFLGLLIIALIYSLYNIFLVDVNYYNDIPRKVRHVNKFLCILAVYGIGTLFLRKNMAPWMMQIWHIIHIIAIVFLLIIGVLDWTLGTTTQEVRNIASTLLEVLISPVLYVAMGIVNSRL